MKTEQEIRDRYDELMTALKKLDVVSGSETKILSISAVLRELDWVLE